MVNNSSIIKKIYFPRLIPNILIFCRTRRVLPYTNNWLTAFDKSALGQKASKTKPGDESWWADNFPQCSSISPKKKLIPEHKRAIVPPY